MDEWMDVRWKNVGYVGGETAGLGLVAVRSLQVCALTNDKVKRWFKRLDSLCSGTHSASQNPSASKKGRRWRFLTMSPFFFIIDWTHIIPYSIFNAQFSCLLRQCVMWNSHNHYIKSPVELSRITRLHPICGTLVLYSGLWLFRAAVSHKSTFFAQPHIMG